MTFFLIARPLVVAFKEMRRYPLRTLLTLSGIAIAIASVVGVGSMLGSVQQLIMRVLDETGGLRNVTVAYKQQREVEGRWVAAQRPNPLSPSDSAALRKLFAEQVAASTTRMNILGTLSSGSVAQQVQAYAVEPGFFDIFSRRLVQGRLLSESDMQNATLVAVIGEHTAKIFFRSQQPIGGELRFSNVRLRVVGVVADTTLGEGHKFEVLFPITTALFRFGDTQRRGASTLIHVKTRQGVDVAQAGGLVLAAIAARHRGYITRDFELVSAEENLSQAKEAMWLIGLIFSLICALSLFTGGVGIMNILLSSVAERTREIGIRRAVGARSRDIRLQFLLEALSFTTLGGILGIVAGYGVGYLLSALVNMVLRLGGNSPFRLEPSLHPLVLVIAVTTSSLVGIVFGYYPAVRASRMDPLEALRAE